MAGQAVLVIRPGQAFPWASGRGRAGTEDIRRSASFNATEPSIFKLWLIFKYIYLTFDRRGSGLIFC